MRNGMRVFVFVVLGFLTASAGVIVNDLSSTPISVDTELSSSTSATTKTLYIGTDGAVSTSPSTAISVWLKAYRYRDATSFGNITKEIEEYVSSEGSADSGFHAGFLAADTVIGSGMSFDGANILYKTEGLGASDYLETAGPGYLGFKISDGAGDFYYGWAEVSAEIEVENHTSGSENRAMVSISKVALMDTAGSVIRAGDVVPEPASVLLIAVGGGLLAFGRRFFRK